MRERFQDRTEAGRRLAQALTGHAGEPDLIVLGLPRGGVPVAAEVARALGAPLDVFVVRKLGVPGHEELAMGAIASGGVRVLNAELLVAAGLSERQVEIVTWRELETLERQERLYRGDRAPLELSGRTVILVDDGLATGATMRAAIQAVRSRDAGRIVVAVPVAPSETCAALRREVDEVACPLSPAEFLAVGRWYRDFLPVSDEQVQGLLAAQASSGTSRSS
jgi:predicted phosphoribosyltransferase